jgi:hypothetical protein
MTPKFRRIAVFVGAAALAGGAGVGVAAQNDSSQAGAAPAITRPAQGGLGGRPDLSALAAELGVSESRLRAAIEATRPSGDPGSAPSGPPHGSDMAAALASELGLSVDKVRSAVQAVGAAGGGPPGGSSRGGAPGGSPGGSAPGGTASSPA